MTVSIDLVIQSAADYGVCADDERAHRPLISWPNEVLALQLTSPQLNRVRAKLLQEVGPYAAVKAHSPLFERHWEADT